MTNCDSSASSRRCPGHQHHHNCKSTSILCFLLSLLSVQAALVHGFILQQSHSFPKKRHSERRILFYVGQPAAHVTLSRRWGRSNYPRSHGSREWMCLQGKLNSNHDDLFPLDDDDFGLDDEPMLVADFRGRPAGVVIEDLSWRVEKLRLEEANTRRFLKAGPRFLPYEECRKWVQAWGNRWQSVREWESWIASGEKRNSYIPSRPEEYFTRTGEWISWDHFLGAESSSKESNEQNNSEQ